MFITFILTILNSNTSLSWYNSSLPNQPVTSIVYLTRINSHMYRPSYLCLVCVFFFPLTSPLLKCNCHWYFHWSHSTTVSTLFPQAPFMYLSLHHWPLLCCYHATSTVIIFSLLCSYHLKLHHHNHALTVSVVNFFWNNYVSVVLEFCHFPHLCTTSYFSIIYETLMLPLLMIFIYSI